MNAKTIATDSIVIFDNLTKLKDQQIQRNREIIERSKHKLTNLKIAKMEMKYFVACSFDCLNRNIPQLISQQKSAPAIIDFNDARNRRIKERQIKEKEHSNNLNNQLSYLLIPGS